MAALDDSALVSLVLVLTAVIAAAQTTPAKPSNPKDAASAKTAPRLSGRVLAGDTGRPLRNANGD